PIGGTGGQVGADTVTLFTQSSQGASVKNDGVNTTVSLVAGAGTGVAQVRFLYSADGGGSWVEIATVGASQHGVFSHEWAPPASLYSAANVRVRAEGLDNLGDPAGITADTVTLSNGVNAANESIELTTAPNASIGVFR